MIDQKEHTIKRIKEMIKTSGPNLNLIDALTHDIHEILITYFDYSKEKLTITIKENQNGMHSLIISGDIIRVKGLQTL
ncbi:MAG: hypothetical protein LBF12_05685 [Christensenellaceae bacterium]|jgi:septum formation topological specificity factor MinE|nr:hypothetical protein [Christensenellaceae bacterium]